MSGALTPDPRAGDSRHGVRGGAQRPPRGREEQWQPLTAKASLPPARSSQERDSGAAAAPGAAGTWPGDPAEGEQLESICRCPAEHRGCSARRGARAPLWAMHAGSLQSLRARRPGGTTGPLPFAGERRARGAAERDVGLGAVRALPRAGQGLPAGHPAPSPCAWHPHLDGHEATRGVPGAGGTPAGVTQPAPNTLQPPRGQPHPTGLVEAPSSPHPSS